MYISRFRKQKLQTQTPIRLIKQKRLFFNEHTYPVDNCQRAIHHLTARPRAMVQLEYLLVILSIFLFFAFSLFFAF